MFLSVLLCQVSNCSKYFFKFDENQNGLLFFWKNCFFVSSFGDTISYLHSFNFKINIYNFCTLRFTTSIIFKYTFIFLSLIINHTHSPYTLIKSLILNKVTFIPYFVLKYYIN